MQEFKYSLDEINSLIPWEREIYLDMLLEYLKEKREEKKRQMAGG